MNYLVKFINYFELFVVTFPIINITKTDIFLLIVFKYMVTNEKE